MLDHIIAHSITGRYSPMPSIFDCEPPAADPPAVPLLYSAGAFKQRAIPARPETPWQRLVRLGEQARDANGVHVKPLTPAYTTFLVSSQRRDAAGVPVRWYRVHVTGEGVQCSCEAQGACAHIGALYLWLVAQAADAAPASEAAWQAESTAERVRYQQIVGRVNMRGQEDTPGPMIPPPPPPEVSWNSAPAADRVAALSAELFG